MVSRYFICSLKVVLEKTSYRWKANPHLSRCHFQEACKVERAKVISLLPTGNLISFRNDAISDASMSLSASARTANSGIYVGDREPLPPNSGMSSILATKVTPFMGPLCQHWGDWREPGKYPKEKWSCPLGIRDYPLCWVLSGGH